MFLVPEDCRFLGDFRAMGGFEIGKGQSNGHKAVEDRCFGPNLKFRQADPSRLRDQWLMACIELTSDCRTGKIGS